MSRIISAFVASISLLWLGGSPPLIKATDSPGVVVVELFTSEGCNSCPSADKVLQKLVDQQAKSKEPVYCLGFHVDYWDKLGWPDKFADRRFTDRQQRYAKVLETDRIYTPQMIVNGRMEFVGSNTKLADRAIAAARAKAATIGVTIATQLLDTGKLRVRYELDGDVNGAALNLAIVETDLQTNVKRGENAGVTLRHANTVRVWESIDPKSTRAGQADLVLPKVCRLDQCRVIAYVQDRLTMQVLGANQSEPLNSERPPKQ